MPFWSVPLDLWANKTVAVLASGAGLTQEVVQKVKNAQVPSIVINTSFRLAPWADMLFAADSDWWLHPDNDDAFKFKGLKVSSSQTHIEGVLRLRVTGNKGYDPDPSCIRTGKSSAYQAIHIAMRAGAKKILLCGVNMTGPNWHGRHPNELRNTEEEQYAMYREFMASLVMPAFYLGVDVVNVTPNSALKCFRVSVLEDELL